MVAPAIDLHCSALVEPIYGHTGDQVAKALDTILGILFLQIFPN